MRLIHQCLLNYLSTITTPNSSLGFKVVYNKLQILAHDGSIESIWPWLQRDAIRAHHQIWDEFKEAYAYDKHHSDFQALLTHATDCPTGDLSFMTQKLHSSLGFFKHAFDIAHTEHKLWRKYHTNNNDFLIAPFNKL